MFGQKNFYSYRSLSSDMPSVMAAQWHAANLFYSVLKFEQKSTANLKALITFQKHLFKLILKCILKIPKVSKI